jgi:transcriptional regulator with XRE-family HTH domain
MQRAQLLKTLKKALRAQRITYDDVASHLGLSRATVKRLFNGGDMTLSRLEAICELAGLELSELVDTMASEEPLVSELTPEQEQELAGNPKLLLMCYLLINRWQMADITRYFEIDDKEARALQRRLRDLNLVEILPFDRIKVLTANNFNWRPNGPVQRYFIEQVQRDFFDAGFGGDDEVRNVLGGLLSEASRRRVVRTMNRLASEIDELSRQDMRLPRAERQPFGAVIALRPWEFSAFTALRRPRGTVDSQAAPGAVDGAHAPRRRNARAGIGERAVPMSARSGKRPIGL